MVEPGRQLNAYCEHKAEALYQIIPSSAILNFVEHSSAMRTMSDCALMLKLVVFLTCTK